MEFVGPASGRNRSVLSDSGDLNLRVSLSPFAYLRVSTQGWVLESPKASHRIHFPGATALEALHALGSPTALKEFLATETENRTALLSMLDTAGMLDVVEDENQEGQDGAGYTGSKGNGSGDEVWEFHDLVFHAASRLGHGLHKRGATFPGAPQPPPSAVREPDHPLIQLVRPENPQPRPGSFEDVLLRRRSVREYSRPVTVAELSEFLCTSCATLRQTTAGGDHPYEALYRPYPSGGGVHPLEVYATTLGVAGLDDGVYRYEPQQHALEPIPVPAGAVERLYHDHGLPSRPSPRTPSVMFVITVRMDRVGWKYSGIAYSLVLKEVGGLFQTFYLVATQMGLAPCAWGTGDPTAFEAATGIDRMAEPSVGEFMLGAR